MKKIDSSCFHWHSFNIKIKMENEFGVDWDKEIILFAEKELKHTPIVPRSTTSREKSHDEIINTAVVDGLKIKKGIPWLYDLYRTDFLALAKKTTGERLVCSSNDLYGINLNIQKGTSMRYECHIDSNPIQGMFYITEHNEKTGGILHVANRTNALNIDDVLEDDALIYPQKGNLVFFDARKHSHFVSALKSEEGIRVAVAMNFYSPTSPESHRPADLTKHLGLE